MGTLLSYPQYVRHRGQVSTFNKLFFLILISHVIRKKLTQISRAKPSASFYEKTFWTEAILQTIGEGTKQ
jgi:hypothetical protein